MPTAMIVMKFGGSSVANREQIDKVLAIVRDRVERQPIVISSAHKGITDGLIDAARVAATGHNPGEMVIERQQEIASSLGCDSSLLMGFYSEIRDLLRGIRLVGELSPRSLDYISSFGERMSVRCLADFFTREGLPAKAFDAWDLGLRTDDNFGRARPLPEYAETMREAFSTLVPNNVVPVVTGFVGKNAKGVITTLGRNGSDLSATLVGAALAAEEVQIWSDTDGVMSADPGIVPAAKSIATMRFDEAAELAYFGSRVLHPATLVPAIEKDISVRVLNTNRPDHRGTVIESAPAPKPSPVTSIAYKEDQTVLTIVEPRMFEQVGFLARFFGVLARHQVVVDLVATSEVSVSVTSHDRVQIDAAVDELRALGQVDVQGGKTILAVVGRHIQHSKGIGSRVLDAISNAEVNIQMHTFGMSSNNISLVINDADIARAVGSLHAALFE